MVSRVAQLHIQILSVAFAGTFHYAVHTLFRISTWHSICLVTHWNAKCVNAMQLEHLEASLIS